MFLLYLVVFPSVISSASFPSPPTMAPGQLKQLISASVCRRFMSKDCLPLHDGTCVYMNCNHTTGTCSTPCPPRACCTKTQIKCACPPTTISTTSSPFESTTTTATPTGTKTTPTDNTIPTSLPSNTTTSSTSTTRPSTSSSSPDTAGMVFVIAVSICAVVLGVVIAIVIIICLKRHHKLFRPKRSKREKELSKKEERLTEKVTISETVSTARTETPVVAVSIGVGVSEENEQQESLTAIVDTSNISTAVVQGIGTDNSSLLSTGKEKENDVSIDHQLDSDEIDIGI